MTLAVAFSVIAFTLAGFAADTGKHPCPSESEFANKLLIHHISVGQGDSTFIRTPRGMTVLIDGGPPTAGREVVAPLLQNCYGLSKLDFVVLTHPHDDHFSGLTELLNESSIHVRFVIDGGDHAQGGLLGPNGRPTSFGDYALATRKAERRMQAFLGMGQIQSGDGVMFNIMSVNGQVQGSAPVQVFKPNGDPVDPNALSISTWIRFGAYDEFIGGDLTGDSPDIESNVARVMHPVDVYRVSHHGSKTSSNSAMLKALQPRQAVVSVGVGGFNKSSFHLPDPEIMSALSGLPTLRNIFLTSQGEGASPKSFPKMNDMKGDVVIITNGSTYNVNSDPRQTFMTDGR